MPQVSASAIAEDLKKKGYAERDVRAVLSRYGYTSVDINSALNNSYGHKLLFAVLIVIAIFVGVGSWLFFSSPSLVEPSISISTSPVQVIAGSSVTVTATVEGFTEGYLNVSIFSKTHEFAVQKISSLVFGEQRLSLKIPENFISDRYAVYVSANNNDKSVSDTRYILVVSKKIQNDSLLNVQNSSDNESSQELIFNQSIDINKPTEQLTAFEACKQSCSTSQMCTSGICSDAGVCSYKRIIPCCGDFSCDVGETSISCPSDCGSAIPVKSASELSKDAVAIASSDSFSAGRLCESIPAPMIEEHDSCFTSIAFVANNENLCDSVSVENPSRNDCYMSLLLSKNNTQTCDKITDFAVLATCKSYATLLKKVSS